MTTTPILQARVNQNKLIVVRLTRAAGQKETKKIKLPMPCHRGLDNKVACSIFERSSADSATNSRSSEGFSP